MKDSRGSPALAILLSGILALLWFPGQAFPQVQALNGRVFSEKRVPISGALCALSGGSLPQGGLSQRSGRNGEFSFSGLTAGDYRLICAAEGFEPISKDLHLSGQSPMNLEVSLPSEVVIHQKVEVREKAPTVTEQEAAPPATFRSQELKTLPGVEKKFQAALPLVPGVIRTPNGRLNIKGVPESQGLLLVDSAQAVDPVTGSFSVDIPTLAIESLQVYKNPYRADFGDLSGGLVSVETRPPSNQRRVEVEDVTPNPRIEAGQLVGIADYNPRLYFTGPLGSSRLSFSEAFGYDIDKQPVRGLAWPHNEIKSEDSNSFSSFQYVFSSHHLLTANVHVFPLHRQFADINSLVPQAASSDYGQHGVSVEVTDLHLSGAGSLRTLVQAMRFFSYGHGQGAGDMLVTPDGWGGNFFNAFSRSSNEQEITETFAVHPKDWHGRHQLTFGGMFMRRSYSGFSRSHPVLLERTDGSVAERIDFSGLGTLAAADTEATLFAQDDWAFTDRLAVDAGLRYSAQTLGGAVNFAPRLGLVYSPGAGGRTIFRGGFGVFFDQDPLLSADFTANQERELSFFDSNGILQSRPVMLPNLYGVAGPNGAVYSSVRRPMDTPFSLSWSGEADREIRPGVLARVSFLASNSHDEFIVNPSFTGAASPALLLSGAGVSSYRELEATLRFRLAPGSELNVSYVHSSARGDLNTLAQVFVPFEQPVIRPNFSSALPADIPNRLIAWGRFKTGIWGILASPIFDIHSGFPFSKVDVLQNYAGLPESQRFPAFVSLDLALGRNFRLPLPWLKKHLMYGELTIYNVTNHLNPRDVFTSIASPYFGHFAGIQHRSYDTSLNIIY